MDDIWQALSYRDKSLFRMKTLRTNLKRMRSHPAVTGILFLIMLSVSAQAENSLRLGWDPNPEPDIGGYVIYYGPASRNYPYHTNVGNVTRATVTGLESGVKWYFAVTATNTAGLESDYSNEVDHTFTADATQSPFVLWQQQYFAASILQDPQKESTTWGDQADPDGDGQNNLLEFAVGTSPIQQQSAEEQIIRASIIDSNGQNYLSLTYRRRSGDSSLQYLPEVSADRELWQSGTNVVQEIHVTSLNEDFEEVVCVDSVPIVPLLPRYMRLSVNREE